MILAKDEKRRKIFVSESGMEWIGIGLHHRLTEFCEIIGTSKEALEIQIIAIANGISVKVNQDCKFFDERIDAWAILTKHSCELALKACLFMDLHVIASPFEDDNFFEPKKEFVRDLYQEHTQYKPTADFCLNEYEKVKKLIKTLPKNERENVFIFLEN